MTIIRASAFTLRSFHPGDAPALARYADNRKIWANVRDHFPHPYTLEDARDFLIHIAPDRKKAIHFAIDIDGEAAGSIGLMVQHDVYRLSYEIGFWLGEPFWGRGIMTEAAGRMVDFAFQQPGIIRVFAQVYEHNPVSMRVLEKNGFKREGILRRAVIKDGVIRDVHVFARLKEEAVIGH